MTTRIAGALDELRDWLGADNVTTSPSVLHSHGRDENFPHVHPPLAVAYADRIEDVQTVLRWCRAHRMPVIPFGAGTSLEGALVPADPASPGISLDFSRMNRVLSIQPENFLAVVQPGVTRTQLNKALRYTGLMFTVDPGADASLGGMAATNASGTTTVRYGGMRQNTLALQVVLANGDVLRVGRPVQKSSSGYDLKDLFVGSSGTLGIFTELTIRLYPIPAHIHTLRIFFPSLTAAAEAAYAVMASALPVARMELVDGLSVRSINRYLGRDYEVAPVLFMEFHSSTAAAIESEVEEVLDLVRESGATDVAIARTTDERTALWEARHHAYWALVNMYPGRTYLITDTAVPLSHLPESIDFAQALLAELMLEGSILGHVGDGNFHTLVAVEPDGYERSKEFTHRLVHHALSLGGTASGEHGIGLVKRPYMAAEHGPALAWMRNVKALFDPDGILNPGKIV